MVPKTIYTATVKHIELTMFTKTHEDLAQLLIHCMQWRQESNLAQDYDLYIRDSDGIKIFETRF